MQIVFHNKKKYDKDNLDVFVKMLSAITAEIREYI